MRTAFTLIVPRAERPLRGEVSAQGSTEKLVIERKVTTETVTQIDSPRFRGEPAPIDRDRTLPGGRGSGAILDLALDEIDIHRSRRWEQNVAAVWRNVHVTLPMIDCF